MTLNCICPTHSSYIIFITKFKGVLEKNVFYSIDAKHSIGFMYSCISRQIQSSNSLILSHIYIIAICSLLWSIVLCIVVLCWNHVLFLQIFLWNCFHLTFFNISLVIFSILPVTRITSAIHIIIFVNFYFKHGDRFALLIL